MQITMTQVREKQESRSSHKRSKANGKSGYVAAYTKAAPHEYVVQQAEEGKHSSYPWKTMKVGDRMFVALPDSYVRSGHHAATLLAHLRERHQDAKGRKNPSPWASFEFTMIADEQNGKEGVSVWRTK